jgi:hypothetical protein
MQKRKPHITEHSEDARRQLREHAAKEEEFKRRQAESIARMRAEMEAAKTAPAERPPRQAKPEKLVLIPKTGLKVPSSMRAGTGISLLPKAQFHFDRPLHQFVTFPDGRRAHIAERDIPAAVKRWQEHLDSKPKPAKPGVPRKSVPKPASKPQSIKKPETESLSLEKKPSPRPMGVPPNLQVYVSGVIERAQSMERGSEERKGLKRMVGVRLMSEGLGPEAIAKILSKL